MNATLLIIFLGVLTDRLLGEPKWLYERVPHPVVLIGRAITALESWLYAAANKKGAGVVLLCLMLGAAWVIGLIMAQFWILEWLMIAALLAQKSLIDHVADVASGLRSSIDEGRIAVARIVGRDVRQLDRPAVARAACESLAENLADGVIAPFFWTILLGLPGLLAYKTLNTLDSMVGYKNARYREFGWASARADDFANWLPARLTGLLYCVVGQIKGIKPIGKSVELMRAHAPEHSSPNAGWPEAALAAVLDLKLAGPRSYGAEMVAGAWMGEGRPHLDERDIDNALDLTRSLLNIVTVLLGLAALIAF